MKQEPLLFSEELLRRELFIVLANEMYLIPSEEDIIQITASVQIQRLIPSGHPQQVVSSTPSVMLVKQLSFELGKKAQILHLRNFHSKIPNRKPHSSYLKH